MKRGILVILFIFLILNISFALSAANSTSSASDKGYSCLTNKVQGQCSFLSTEEKIFSMLAIGQCKSEILSDASNSQCWPQSGCTIKTTAQAMLALKGTSDLNRTATWLAGQRLTPSGLNWLLQIDSNEPAQCTISYPTSSGTSSITVSIDANKQLSSSNYGTCFKLYSGGYWLSVQSACFDKELSISCDNSFTTNLLYQDSASSTIYVLNELNSAAAEGTTKETASAYCLKQGTSCDYEGTLWAALALQNAGYNYKPYIPYLVAKQSLNEQYLPESFLYVLLGGSYQDSLLARQQQNSWWLVSGDKFYDTALALYPFQQQDLTEKSNSIDWLSSVQGADGCWQDNIRNTAFLLYSVWPKTVSGGTITQNTCTQNGYFCSSSANCDLAGGNVLNNYTGCFGSNICCTKQVPLQSCSTLGGVVCSSSQVCSTSTSQSSDGECCTGTCQAPTTTPSCDSSGGTCKSSCSGNEIESSYSCSGSDTCCLAKSSGGTNYLGIIILSVLIVLVLIGILFRKKIKLLFTKKKGGNKPQGRMPPRGFPPSSQISPRMMPRRIIPSSARPAYRPSPSASAGKSKETEDVLKKLKELGK